MSIHRENKDKSKHLKQEIDLSGLVGIKFSYNCVCMCTLDGNCLVDIHTVEIHIKEPRFFLGSLHWFLIKWLLF